LKDIGAGPGAVDAVVMVGGTSKIPAVRRFVAELLEQEPAVGIDPMTAVGEGAAIAAAVLTGELETHDFFVATEHALGTIAVHPATNELTFSEIIPRNHKLPASKTETFRPLTAEQDRWTIQVIEGDPSMPLGHPDNVVLQEFHVRWQPGRPDRTLDMTYEYDVDGILHISVRDNISDTVIHTGEISFGVTADRRKLVEMSRRARQAVATGQVGAEQPEAASALDPDAVKLLQEAEVKVIPFLSDDEAAPVKAAVAALRAADAEALAGHKARLREALAPYSYLL